MISGGFDTTPPTRRRADAVDGLALLTARLLPGSPAARGLARLNRGLDVWAWSPRRRRRPERAAEPRPQLTAVG